MAKRKVSMMKKGKSSGNPQGQYKVAMGIDMYGKKKAVPSLSAMKKKKIISSLD